MCLHKYWNSFYRSATSKLTMENVPWHADVKAFSEALALRSEGEYEVACEHVHSCCVLLAKTERFKVNGQWFTWIDYEKFHDLVSSAPISIFGVFKMFPFHDFIIWWKCRLLQEDLSAARTTWLPPHTGLSMVLRKVDLIQISLGIGRSDITNQVADG